MPIEKAAKAYSETQEEYICLAKDGSTKALAAVITELLPAVRGEAARVVYPGLDFEDAMQEGFIGLYRAIQTYSKREEASFKTYATVCIHNAVVSAGKKARAKKHRPLNYATEMVEDISVIGPEEVTIQKEQYDMLIECIRTKLSVLEQKALRLYIEGKSYSEIAVQCGITPKAVDNAMQRLRRKLKQQ